MLFPVPMWTKTLQGGNSRTSLLCCCSPSSNNILESLSTIRFGQRSVAGILLSKHCQRLQAVLSTWRVILSSYHRAKQIRNKPVVNRQLGVSGLKKKLEESQWECQLLRAQLKQREHAQGTWIVQTCTNPVS